MLMLSGFACLLQPTACAQKYAVVNTDYVLKSVPDYASAQKRLDRYVEDWRKEIADKAAELDAMRADYEQESYLLPENLKKRRQADIKDKEQEVRALQQQHFGPGGDLDKRTAELLKPVQDRVYNAIERIAHEKNYAFVFDKAGSATVLFASKKYDISDDVLESLGYKPGQAAQDKGSGVGDKSSADKGSRRQQEAPTNPEMKRSGIGKNPGNAPMPLGDVKRR